MDIIDLKSTMSQFILVKIYTITHHSKMKILFKFPLENKLGDTGTYPGT